MNVVLRAASREDYEAMCALFAQEDHLHYQALPQFFRPIDSPARPQEFVAEILANEDAALFVAEQQGILVGLVYCRVHTTPPVPLFVPRRYVFIGDLVVSESFRHRGIGQALVERVHQWTQEKGVTEVELSVWEFNSSAHALYEKLGYQTTRRIMRKQLL